MEGDRARVTGGGGDPLGKDDREADVGGRQVVGDEPFDETGVHLELVLQHREHGAEVVGAQRGEVREALPLFEQVVEHRHRLSDERIAHRGHVDRVGAIHGIAPLEAVIDGCSLGAGLARQVAEVQATGAVEIKPCQRTHVHVERAVLLDRVVDCVQRNGVGELVQIDETVVVCHAEAVTGHPRNVDVRAHQFDAPGVESRTWKVVDADLQRQLVCHLVAQVERGGRLQSHVVLQIEPHHPRNRVTAGGGHRHIAQHVIAPGSGIQIAQGPRADLVLERTILANGGRSASADRLDRTVGGRSHLEGRFMPGWGEQGQVGGDRTPHGEQPLIGSFEIQFRVVAESDHVGINAYVGCRAQADGRLESVVRQAVQFIC